MEDKAESKLIVHQALIKNGFYRLPMHSLSEILKLIEMPESLEAKVIQENTILGIIKIIQKYKDKYADHFTSSPISKQTKDYLGIIIQDVLASGYKKQNFIPPGLPSQMPQAMFPLSQMGYMRPPMMPPTFNDPSQSQADMTRLVAEEQMRMQQLYMFYCSMYGGPNHMMFNPQFMANFMNSYGFPPMANSNHKKIPPSIANSMNPLSPLNPMNPLMSMMNPLSSMNPLNPIANPLASPLVNPHSNLNSHTSTNTHVPQNSLQNQLSNTTNAPQVRDQLYPSSLISPMANLQRPDFEGETQKETIRNKSKVSHFNQQKQSKPKQRGSYESKKLKEPDYNEKHEKKKKNGVSPAKTTTQSSNFLNTIPNSHNNLNSPLEKKQTQTVPKNYIAEANLNLKYCACKGHLKFEHQFICSICSKTYHCECLNEPFSKLERLEPIECYHCRMRFIDPLNQVKQVIGEYYIPQLTDKKFLTTVNLKPFEYLCKLKGSKFQIEMRCLKVSCSSDNNEITWPDECIIKLNGERIIEIPALQNNSSLKKRKDYSILITGNIYNKIFDQESSLEKMKLSLEIKNLTKQDLGHKKIRNDFTFAFGIYFIQKLTIDELYNKIVQDEVAADTTGYIKSLMKTDENEIEIDKIVVTLYDPFTWDLIKTPVRGQKCLHGQCYDLKTFICFMASARNRTWKCPVCTKDSRKFMIDKEQLELIKRVSENNSIPSEVSFLKDGTIMLKVDAESDEDGERKGEKTKKIIKELKIGKSEKESQSKSNQNEIEKKKYKEFVWNTSVQGKKEGRKDEQKEK